MSAAQNVEVEASLGMPLLNGMSIARHGSWRAFTTKGSAMIADANVD